MTTNLTRRERQIMDVLYALRSATASQVRAKLDSPLSYSTVRTFLNVLERKGHVSHSQVGKAYVYTPIVAVEQAAGHAIRGVVETFFRGSATQAIAALLQLPGESIGPDDLSAIEALLADARRQKEDA